MVKDIVGQDGTQYTNSLYSQIFGDTLEMLEFCQQQNRECGPLTVINAKTDA